LRTPTCQIFAETLLNDRRQKISIQQRYLKESLAKRRVRGLDKSMMMEQRAVGRYWVSKKTLLIANYFEVF